MNYNHVTALYAYDTNYYDYFKKETCTKLTRYKVMKTFKNIIKETVASKSECCNKITETGYTTKIAKHVKMLLLYYY